MNRLLLPIALALLTLVVFFPSKVLSTSPIRCGKLNEACCGALAGTDQDCDDPETLECVDGRCVAKPGAEDPPTRGNVTPSQNNDPDFTNDFSLSNIQSSTGLSAGFANLGDIVSAAIPYIFAAAGLLLLLYLILGGIQLMTSRGDPKAMQSAKEKITGALIGFVIVFASFWIVQLLGQVLGIEAFSQIFG